MKLAVAITISIIISNGANHLQGEVEYGKNTKRVNI